MNKIFSKTLTVLMSAIFILTSLPLVVQASQNTWDPDNGVYDISTEADLLEFRDCLNNAKSNSDYYFENKTVNQIHYRRTHGKADDHRVRLSSLDKVDDINIDTVKKEENSEPKIIHSNLF